jgi:cell division protease FtsH
MTKHDSVLTMMEHPGSVARSGAPLVTADKDGSAGHSIAVPGPMGSLETQEYKKEWRAAYRYRAHLEHAAAERKHELMIKQLEVDAIGAAEKAMRDTGGKPRDGTSRGLPSLRDELRPDDEDEEEERRVRSDKKGAAPAPVTSGRVAAQLLFARLFDARPELHQAIKASAPVIIIDVPDGDLMDRVVSTWKDVLFSDTTRLLKASGRTSHREDYDAVYLVVKEQPKAKDKQTAQAEALSGLSLALPFVAISPLGTTHLAEALIKSCTARLEMPRIDAVTIMRVIRIVTGKPCRDLLEADAAAKTGLEDLIIAVRFDRTPAACMAELRRLAAEKEASKKSRDLTLDQLHGMAEAVGWAKSTIADINAWRAGEITWDAVNSSVALTGPPGTGKTTFAKVFAGDAGNLPLILGSLAKWQSSGEAHLGHLLRAMRQDFDAARAQAPSVLFIDEIDSFPDRAGVTHAHRDYVIEVVNALLEQVDGIAAGRDGIILIGASNDLSRCDPALLRAGRFNHIVKISLPHPGELEKMLRVRLGSDLRDEDLRAVSELAIGMTGADIEKVVNDAKRVARQATRNLTISDLRQALVEEDDRPAELQFRSCVHEASHIVVDVIHNGPEDIFATAAVVAGHAGASVRMKLAPRAGTYDDYCKALEIILAGRIGEEMVFGAGSHGAGGASGSDLERATTLAAAMAGSFGLTGPTPLIYLGPAKDAHGFVSLDDIRGAVNAELVQAAKSCRALLELRRESVIQVANHLSEFKRIDGAEVARILDGEASARGVGSGATELRLTTEPIAAAPTSQPGSRQ